MTKDELNNLSTFDAAKYYDSLGLQLVPVPRKERFKEPTASKWQLKTFDLTHFVNECNIGGKTGAELLTTKGLFFADVDIDLKHADGLRILPGAVELVSKFIPPSGFVFGRASAPGTHHGYLTTAPVTTRQYRYGDAMLLELRGLTNGKRGNKPAVQQSVLPPGLHVSKELIQFDVFDALRFFNAFDAEGLATLVRYSAVALAILKEWPELGKLHDARLAFAKILQCPELPPDVGERILVAVNEVTGGDVRDAHKAWRDTASMEPDQALGASWIIEHLDGGVCLKAIDQALGRKRQGKEGAIIVNSIDLKTLTPRVWEMVRAADVPPRCFTQGGLPVRVVHMPEHAKDKRPTWVFQSLEHARLTHQVAQYVTFEWHAKEYVRIVPPPKVLITDMLAATPAAMPLPAVSRITYAPTLGHDGTVEVEEGYHASTGTFYVPDPNVVIPPVPDAPTQDEIDRAHAQLLEPLREFPFATEADRTRCLSLLLLPFVRAIINGPTPLHLIKKPVAGAGATLLTDVLMFPALGSDVAKITTVNDDDEWRKTLTATLLDGPSATCIDNARELLSPVLAKAITDTTWNARILGTPRAALLPVECVWIATGINPDLHTEIRRRTIPIRLIPQTAKPWTRDDFTIPNLMHWSRLHRAEMIHSALVIARAWHVAGRPFGTKTLGMFESWASTMGGLLSIIGRTDLLDTIEVLADIDVEGTALTWLATEWWAQHQDRAVKMSEVAIWALQPHTPISDFLKAQTDRGRATEFSLLVRSLSDRFFEVGGRLVTITQARTLGDSRAHTWKLLPAEPAEPAALPEPQMKDVDIPF